LQHGLRRRDGDAHARRRLRDHRPDHPELAPLGALPGRAAVTAVPSSFVRRTPPRAVRRRRLLVTIADHSLLIAGAVLFLAPVVFVTLTALMTNTRALSPQLWPDPFQWSNFVDVFHRSPLWRWVLNSFIY